MNDYGEIVKISCNKNEIFRVLEKLLKNNELKKATLINIDEENQSFDFIVKNIIIGNSKISVTLKDIKKELTEIKIISFASYFVPFDFDCNKDNVKWIIDNILGKLVEEDKLKNTNDVSVEIIKIKNSTKRFVNFLLLLIGFFLGWAILPIFINLSQNGKIYLDYDSRITCIFFAIITTIIYSLIKFFAKKGYSQKRTAKIKEKIKNLQEKKISDEIAKKEVIKSKEVKNVDIKLITKKVQPHFDKGIDYLKKLKKDKPKQFWGGVIALSILLGWTVFGGGSTVLGNPCDFNVKIGGYRVTDISWCRSDIKIDERRIKDQIPAKFKVTPDDFVYCKYGTPDVYNGWAEGFVYKKCAIKMGWKK